jgi:D-glycero-D-manno-heptose 1,7-bisphosphate phosphatase
MARVTTMTSSQRWAVFLDRDGVLTEAHMRSGVAGSARSISELTILPGAGESTRVLRELGAMVFVVTNQPDVARGLLDEADLLEMNAILVAELDIDGVRVCTHTGSDGCECRKPKPGMMTSLGDEFDIDLSRSVVVGDRWVDVQAGRSAGAHTILVQHPHSWAPTSAGAPPADLAPDVVVRDISHAAAVISSMQSSTW